MTVTRRMDFTVTPAGALLLQVGGLSALLPCTVTAVRRGLRARDDRGGLYAVLNAPGHLLDPGTVQGLFAWVQQPRQPGETYAVLVYAEQDLGYGDPA